MTMYDEVQKLIANQDFAAFTNVGVAHKESGDHLIFDYEIDADWKSPLPWLCRGLVAKKDGQIICSPMKKFWNSSESNAAPIDWTSAVAFEKMDGTMVNRWYDGKQWQYSTRYNLGEGLSMRLSGIGAGTWNELIRAAMKTVDTSAQPEDETWTYEVCSPYNRVVVKYAETFAVLLSRRKTATGEELPIDGISGECRTHNVSSLEDATAYVNRFDGVALEGVVAFDGKDRVKLKNASYVWWHHIRSEVGATWKNMLNVYFAGEQSEFVAEFPDFKPHFDTIAQTIDSAVAESESFWQGASQAPTRKEYALMVNAANPSMKKWCFDMYGKPYVSPKVWLNSMDANRRADWAESIGLRTKLEQLGNLNQEELS